MGVIGLVKLGVVTSYSINSKSLNYLLYFLSSSTAEGFHPDEQWRSSVCIHSSVGDRQGQCEMAQSLQGAILPVAEEITQ